MTLCLELFKKSVQTEKTLSWGEIPNDSYPRLLKLIFGWIYVEFVFLFFKYEYDYSLISFLSLAYNMATF